MPSFNILIIRESDSFCSFLSALLAEDGHVTLCSTGDRDALKIVRMWQPDIILLEASRSNPESLDVMGRLQRTEETRHLPVMVIGDAPEIEYELASVFDFMLKPIDVDRLRDNIARLGRRKKQRVQPVRKAALEEGDFVPLAEFLITHSGLHFERRNLKALERGVASRMTALHIGNYPEYFDYLKRHRETRGELQKLIQLLTVGETYFFRYRAHFDAIGRILTEEEQTSPQKRIRIWSAGCSSGEEPYSLAIKVMEVFPDWERRDIRILATDINNRALKRASDGVYGRWAMRAMEQRYLDRYFDRVGDSYLVKEDVKRLVEFRHLNLQTGQFPSEDGEFSKLDAIFCRNVTIYFSLATTKKLVERFAAALRPGGYLFLGHAETLAYVSSRFERQYLDGGFYYRKKDAKGPAVVSLPKGEPPRRLPSSPAPSPPPSIAVAQPPAVAASERPRPKVSVEGLYEEAQRNFEAENYEAASRLIDELLREEPHHGMALVTRGFIVANGGAFQDALEICNQALAVNDLLPEAYFLKGLIVDMIEKPAKAAEEYRKAILLDMDFVMPRYHLGRLYFRLGKEREGERELRNCLKILQKLGEGRIVPFSGGLTREVFLGQLRDEMARTSLQPQ